MPGETSTDIQTYISDVYELVSETTESTVTREEIEQEFQKFVEYGVPLPQAKQTLLQKYKGKSSTPVSSERILLADLEANMPSAHVQAKIISVNPKTISVKGEEKTIYYGLLRDESTTVSFTAWTDFQLEKGAIVDITNAYTKEWQNAIQINLGDRTSVNPTSNDALATLDSTPREAQIKDLQGGMGSVELLCRILDVKKREVTVENKKKQVFSGVIGDATGKAQFTAWHDFSLAKDDVIKIKGGYVKTWKGVPQVTFDEKATVKKMEDSTIPADQISSQQMRLHELVEKGGALDVQTSGTVIEIRQGSGFILRCPECNRVLQDGSCSIHGSVKGIEDVRVKLVLDDGTGAVQCTINKELTESLLKKKMQEWKQLSEEQVYAFLYEQLFGQHLTVRGNALGDQYGTTFIVHQVDHETLNIQQHIEQLTHDMEELA